MREIARQLISDISSYDLYAQFRVDLAQKKFIITGRLTTELTERIKQYKADLIDYLTTPPDILGICRNGHRVRWICTKYGLWVCACYLLPPKEETIPVKRSSPSVKSYWTKKESTSVHALSK